MAPSIAVPLGIQDHGVQIVDLSIGCIWDPIIVLVSLLIRYVVVLFISYFSIPIKGPVLDPLWQEVQGKPVSQLQEEQGEELPLFKTIRANGYRREPYLISETIKAIARGNVRIVGREVQDAQGSCISGYDLTSHIEASLKADQQ